MDITKEQGVLLAHEKMEGPATVLSYLRIELDMVQAISWLPMEQLRAFQNVIDYLLGKSKATLKECQV